MSTNQLGNRVHNPDGYAKFFDGYVYAISQGTEKGRNSGTTSMKKITDLVLFASLCVCCVFPSTTLSADSKVLVVMSYEENNPWSAEIRKGIDSILSGSSEITYFYMDTKINFESGPTKAEEAYALFQLIKPDGVITADDNAQKMFVLPFLKQHSETPVMFCGVNAEPERYGYPAPNVSGILERGHIRESIALAKQLHPSLRSVAFIAKESPSGRALSRQVESESDSYLVESTVHLVTSLDDLYILDELLRDKSTAIYIDSIEGIKDKNGVPLSNKEILSHLSERYDNPIIGANQYHVELGALCAVVKTGEEQGRTAAEMLQKAMQGTPVDEIPIARNYQGQRIINVTKIKELGLQVRPIVLLGSKLIRSSR